MIIFQNYEVLSIHNYYEVRKIFCRPHQGFCRVNISCEFKSSQGWQIKKEVQSVNSVWINLTFSHPTGSDSSKYDER